MGAEPGARPAVPRGAQGGGAPRDRRDRRRVRPGGRALHARGVRRHRAAVLALVDRARLPLPGHQPPRRTSTAGRLANRARLLLEIVDAVREAIGPRPRPRGAAVRGRADRGRDRHRRRGGGGPDGRGHRPGRLHQHLDRGGHRHAVHDRGQHAGPSRVRPVHPQRHPPGGDAAGGRGGPVQGPPAGRPGARRRACAIWSAWCGARSPTPTSRPRPGRDTPTTSAPACRATRSASAGWASTGGSAASRTRGPAASRVARPAPRPAPAGGGGRRRPGRAAGRGHRRRARPPGDLFERQDRLGGQVAVAAAVPSRAEFLDITRN